MAARVAPWRFTVDEYHRIAESGVFGEDDRVELIEGEISRMSPLGSRHVSQVTEATWLLGRRLGDDVRVSVQSPIRLHEYGEPQPDLAVIRARNYDDQLPGPDVVLIVIEVADTSVSYDRGVKFPLYARSSIPEAWLVDLVGHAVERHSDPTVDGYATVVRFRSGETIASLVLPDLVLDVDAVLG